MKVFRLILLAPLVFFGTNSLQAQTNDLFQLMEQAIQDSPAVQAAKIDIDRAEATAGSLEAGPYEFEFFVSGARREINDPLVMPNEFDEWEAGISRTVRLPGKRSTDLELASLEVEFARAKYAKVLNDQQWAFIENWNDWSRLALLSGVLEEQYIDARRLADLEQKKVDDGAGRQVNADQLKLEADLIQLELEQNNLAKMNARSRLETSYPNVIFPVEPISFAIPDFEALLAEDEIVQPEQRLAEIASEQASYSAMRSRQNRLPDPTLQLSYTDEFGGLENTIVASISIPIGGKARSSASREAEAYSLMQTMNLEQIQRQANQNFYSVRQGYSVALQSLERAKSAQDASQSVLDRIQQGYRSGNMTLTELLAARRSHRQTERYIIEQTANAELAAMKYWILAEGSFTPE